MTSQPLPTQAITLDMDGSFFDPWACCGRRDNTHIGTDGCRHLRQDTVEALEALLVQYPDATAVVLSWRSGMAKVTQEWLDLVGIEVTHVFVPGSDDTVALGAKDAGQVGFKVNVVQALQAQGVEIVGGFEDNPKVVAALIEAGAPVTQVEHLVEVHAGQVGPEQDWYNVDQTPIANFDWTTDEPTLWEAVDRMPAGLLEAPAFDTELFTEGARWGTATVLVPRQEAFAA